MISDLQRLEYKKQYNNMYINPVFSGLYKKSPKYVAKYQELRYQIKHLIRKVLWLKVYRFSN